MSRIGATFRSLEEYAKKLQAGLQENTREWKATATTLNSIANVYAVVGGAIVGAVTAISAAGVKAGESVHDAASRFMMSAETYTALAAAADQVHASIDSMGIGMLRLSRAAGAAARGNETAASSFRRLGINIYDSSGHLKNQEQLLYEAADAISRIKSPTERAAAAWSLFSRNARGLLPLLAQGSKGIKELEQRAKEFGAQMSSRTAASVDMLGDRLRLLRAGMGNVAATIAGQLAPTIIVLVNHYGHFNAWLQRVAERHPTLIKVMTALALTIGGLSLVIGAFLKSLVSLVRAYEALQIVIHSTVYAKLKDVSASVAAALANTALGKAVLWVASTFTKLWTSIFGPAGKVIAVILVIAGAIYGLYKAWRGYKNEVDEVKDSIKEAQDAMAKAKESMNELDDSTKGSSLTMVDSVQATKELADALDNLEMAERRVRDATKELRDAQADLPRAERDAAREIRDAQESVADAQEQLDEAYRKSAEERRNAVDKIYKAEEKYQEEVEDAQRSIEDAETRLAEKLLDAADDEAKAKDKVREANDRLIESEKELEEASRSAEERISEAMKRGAERIEAAKKRLREIQMKMAGYEEPEEVRLARELQEAKKELEGARQEAAENVRKALDEGKKEVERAQKRVEEAEKAKKEAEEELEKERRKASQEIAQLQKEVEDARRKAQKRLDEARQEIDKARDEAVKQQQESEKRIREAERQLRNAIEAYARAQETAANRVAAAVDRITKAVEGLRDAEKSLAKTREDVAKARQQVEEANQSGKSGSTNVANQQPTNYQTSGTAQPITPAPAGTSSPGSVVPRAGAYSAYVANQTVTVNFNAPIYGEQFIREVARNEVLSIIHQARFS